MIPNRVSIEDRPDIVDQKYRLADWECDTVVGKDRKAVLVTLVERKSLYTPQQQGGPQDGQKRQ